MSLDQIDIFLQPGEYFVGDRDYRICTLLGSCVSITLWHPGLKIGAMSHFLLAQRQGAPAEEPDGRYGDEAMQLMCRELRQAKVKVSECQGKIFGGGNMFPKQGGSGEGASIGRRNGEAARRLLQLHHIPLVSDSLYGVGHRKIIFDVNTGHVWSRQMKPETGTT